LHGSTACPPSRSCGHSHAGGFRQGQSRPREVARAEGLNPHRAQTHGRPSVRAGPSVEHRDPEKVAKGGRRSCRYLARGAASDLSPAMAWTPETPGGSPPLLTVFPKSDRRSWHGDAHHRGWRRHGLFRSDATLPQRLALAPSLALPTPGDVARKVQAGTSPPARVRGSGGNPPTRPLGWKRVPSPECGAPSRGNRSRWAKVAPPIVVLPMLCGCQEPERSDTRGRGSRLWIPTSR
jgi:hypothetical protein